MKAKLLNDKMSPDFLYDIKNLDEVAGTVVLCWTTRDYNESLYNLSEVELIQEDKDK